MSWDTVKLTDVCDFQGGTQPPKSSWSTDHKPGYIRMLQSRDFTQGKDSFIEYVKNVKTLKKCNSEDILIGRYGASIGKILTGLSGAYNVALVKTVPSKKISRKYLYFYLVSDTFQNFIQNAGSRAAQAGFNKDELDTLYISLPPLQLQEQIADILEKGYNLRIKDHDLLLKYDELAHAVFYKMFGDPIKNEMGWSKTILKSVTSKIGSGSTPTGGKVAYKASGISLIRSMNIYDFAFKWKDLAYIDDKQAAKLDSVKVKSKDVLFNITGASVCRCSIVPDEVLPARVNQHVAILRANQVILNPIFLNHLLVSNSVKTNLLKVGSSGGAVMEAITKEKLENHEIILPPIELQNQFEKTIDLVFNGKKSMIEILEKSNQLFDSLIKKYLLVKI